MEVCGVSIVESRVVLAVVGTLAVVLLLGLTALAVWADGRYQRSEYVRRNGGRTRWRTREEREAEDDDD